MSYVRVVSWTFLSLMKKQIIQREGFTVGPVLSFKPKQKKMCTMGGVLEVVEVCWCLVTKANAAG